MAKEAEKAARVSEKDLVKGRIVLRQLRISICNEMIRKGPRLEHAIKTKFLRLFLVKF